MWYIYKWGWYNGSHIEKVMRDNECVAKGGSIIDAIWTHPRIDELPTARNRKSTRISTKLDVPNLTKIIQDNREVYVENTVGGFKYITVQLDHRNRLLETLLIHHSTASWRLKQHVETTTASKRSAGWVTVDVHVRVDQQHTKYEFYVSLICRIKLIKRCLDCRNGIIVPKNSFDSDSPFRVCRSRQNRYMMRFTKLLVHTKFSYKTRLTRQNDATTVKNAIPPYGGTANLRNLIPQIRGIFKKFRGFAELKSMDSWNKSLHTKN